MREKLWLRPPPLKEVRLMRRGNLAACVNAALESVNEASWIGVGVSFLGVQ